MKIHEINYVQSELLLYFLIEYYYDDIEGNERGGRLRSVLEGEDFSKKNIVDLRLLCETDGDTLGMFICDKMLELNEAILEELYIKRWGRF